MSGETLNSVLVIDNGSSACRAGLSGDIVPSICFPLELDRPLHQKLKDDETGASRYRFMGLEDRPSSIHQQKALDLTGEGHPVKHGVVSNWDDMETIWRHVYDSLNISDRMNQMPVLITEVPLNPKLNREKMGQVMFEKFDIPAVFFPIPAVMSLFASGRQNGIVLDCGHDVTHVASVYQGLTVDSAIFRMELGGNDLTHHLMKKLNENSPSVITKEMARDIKEKVCQTAIDYDNEVTNKEPLTSYELPDGKIINVSNQDRLTFPEALFRPYLVDKDMDGCMDLVQRSVAKCDAVVRGQLYSNAVLSGGSTFFTGLVNRFEQELKSLAPPKAKINVIAKEDRRNSAWLGGSLVASMTNAFLPMCVTKKEYEEFGAAAVRRKHY